MPNHQNLSVKIPISKAEVKPLSVQHRQMILQQHMRPAAVDGNGLSTDAKIEYLSNSRTVCHKILHGCSWCSEDEPLRFQSFPGFPIVDWIGIR